MKLLRTTVVSASLLAMLAGGAMVGTAIAQDKITLTFVRPGSPEAVKKVYQPILDAFMKLHPNVTIQPTYMGFDEMFQRMPLAAATGKLPDVFMPPGLLMPPLAANNVLLPLGDSIPPELKSDIAQSYWDAATWNGQIVAVPAVINPQALWYNADLFKQAGLDPDKPPTTWDELVADAKAITEKTGVPGMGVYGFKRNDVVDELAAVVQSNSDVWYWDQKNQAIRPDVDVTGGLQFLTDLVQKDKVTQPDVDAYSSDDVRGMLRDGKVAMVISSPPTLSVVGKDPKFRTALMPVGPTGKASSVANMDPWVVSATTQHADMAKELVWFLSSAENVNIAATGYGTLPPLSSVIANNPTYKSGIWPAFVDTMTKRAFYSTKPITPQMSMSTDTIPNMAQQALTGKMSPADSLTQLFKSYGWPQQ
jgi:multiple sugar transport system substrate-binding protein